MKRVGMPARLAHTATFAALPPGVSITSPNVSPPRSSSLLVRMSTSQAKSPMTHQESVQALTIARNEAQRVALDQAVEFADEESPPANQAA